MYPVQVMENISVAAGATEESDPITWDGHIPQGGLGKLSIQITFTGTGTITIAWEASNLVAAATFKTPTNETATDIAAGVTTGTYVLGVPMDHLYKFIRFTVEETGGINPVVVTSMIVTAN